jgi:hypothetical protein
VKNLGLDIEEELIPLMYTLMDAFKESLQTQEIQTQLVKNLMFLLQNILQLQRED